MSVITRVQATVTGSIWTSFTVTFNWPLDMGTLDMTTGLSADITGPNAGKYTVRFPPLMPFQQIASFRKCSVEKFGPKLCELFSFG
jgi:hypothetical protein